jgi:hypothetical protein
VWLTSDATDFHIDKKWAGNSLVQTGNTTSSGSDALGLFSKTTISWSQKGSTFLVDTAFRVYESGDIIAFEQNWVSGANDTAVDTAEPLEEVLSSFPAFKLDPKIAESNLATMSWEGAFMDGTRADSKDISNIGPQPGKFPEAVRVGSAAGPIVLFDQDQHGAGDSLVLSPMGEFMVHNFAKRDSGTPRKALCSGIMGSVKNVPPGFMHSTVIFHGTAGVNNAVTDWGDALLKFHNKTTQARDTDPVGNAFL